ncbi:MAG: hypothetical protein JNM33_12710, partial [Rubrivivax sp.]|nr:hypothetical protein [Rubrivivax sp.]
MDAAAPSPPDAAADAAAPAAAAPAAAAPAPAVPERGDPTWVAPALTPDE